MKMTLELNEILEAKLIELLEFEGQGEHPESRILGLLEKVIDEELESCGAETPEEFEVWLLENAV